MNSCRAVDRERSLSCRSSITVSRPLDAVLAMCFLYLRLVSIRTPRILIWSLDLTVCLLIVKGSQSNLEALEVKCMMAFLCLKSCPTSSFPVEYFFNDSLNTFPVALCSWSRYLYSKIIHESKRTSLAVDLLLYKVCVEEEEWNRGQRRALR